MPISAQANLNGLMLTPPGLNFCTLGSSGSYVWAGSRRDRNDTVTGVARFERAGADLGAAPAGFERVKGRDALQTIGYAHTSDVEPPDRTLTAQQFAACRIGLGAQRATGKGRRYRLDRRDIFKPAALGALPPVGWSIRRV